MADDSNLQQEILQKTLQEVEQLNGNDSQPCVICLEQVSEPAQATPCGHKNFDFLCLTSWLEQQPTCPLCKSAVKSVLYGFQEKDGPKEYIVITSADRSKGPTDRPVSTRHGSLHPIALRERRRPRRPRRSEVTSSLNDGVARRRYIYKHRLFSCRVGSNRMSQYRELSPEMFNSNEALVQRARRWIRRELQVFSFLYPESEDSTETEQAEIATPTRRVAKSRDIQDRRSSNAEFLLEYIISILRTVDIKSASGSAEDLLQEFLGRDNARLFLHELHAFLRSPYENLRDWDAAVQYDESTALGQQRQAMTSETRGTRDQSLSIYPDSYVPNYDRDVDRTRRKRRRLGR